ncbi:MAG: hypothetical protein M1819_005271 [Sarea resinae]|nr:MAG: hypothetical protein M1819_005271 [Sarea resinae]
MQETEAVTPCIPAPAMDTLEAAVTKLPWRQEFKALVPRKASTSAPSSLIFTTSYIDLLLRTSIHQTMGALEHQFTKDQLDYINLLREVQKQSWSGVTKAFNAKFSTNITIDEIRWAYSNLA